MEFEDKIYKKCDLECDDSISSYEHWGAQQNYNVFETFHNFLKEVKPSQILEIGTSLGGFTCFLNYTCQKCKIDCKILTYDINETQGYNFMIENGIDARVENVFNDDYSIVKQEVIDFIQKNGTTLVLCDGGNKISEFNLLSNYLKDGDIIMAHDYAKDEETFNSEVYKKLWNWFEISDKDIQSACKQNNLMSYKDDIFNKVVWVGKIKKG